jgi:hypothetical protein
MGHCHSQGEASAPQNTAAGNQQQSPEGPEGRSDSTHEWPPSIASNKRPRELLFALNYIPTRPWYSAIDVK